MTTQEPIQDAAQLARLRRRYAGASGLIGAQEPCPEPARLWAAAHKELPPEELEGIVDHLARCPECAEDWRLACHVGGQISVPDRWDMPIRPVAWRWRPQYFPRGLAAAALLAAAAASIPVTTWWIQKLDSDSAVSQQHYELRAETASGATLPRSDAWLRWNEGPEGTLFNLTVTVAARGVRLLEVTELAQPEMKIPEHALDNLPAGTVLQWQVRAQLPGGDEVSSEVFRVLLE